MAKGPSGRTIFVADAYRADGQRFAGIAKLKIGNSLRYAVAEIRAVKASDLAPRQPKKACEGTWLASDWTNATRE
jgi:hypothetical protein